jgi:hypothetical protein
MSFIKLSECAKNVLRIVIRNFLSKTANFNIRDTSFKNSIHLPEFVFHIPTVESSEQLQILTIELTSSSWPRIVLINSNEFKSNNLII